MLITIYAEEMELSEGGKDYVFDRAKKLGIETKEICSKFVMNDNKDDTFIHSLLVANIPTLEKFVELIRLFEQDGWVYIETHTSANVKNGARLVDEDNLKYYLAPRLFVE